MKTIGIITIHKIYNYGSVFQAYALQKVCESLGYKAEIIDYQFPNDYHKRKILAARQDSQPSEPKYIKLLFARALMRQHRGISEFVKKYEHLSPQSYSSPQDLLADVPRYDIYITGSDQLWSPRHCKGDPAFMLHFAPDEAAKISYAASIGTDYIPEELVHSYREYLSRYDAISVREESGVRIVNELTGKNARVVLDPTLLLDRTEWSRIASPRRQVRKKYVLCYFLNYSFNAFPYVDRLAEHIRRETGYEIVRVARPPHKLDLFNTGYRIGASPEEFLALVRDAEIVLTTSFHGTAFAVNFGKPVLSVVKGLQSSDSRQAGLLRDLGLENNILPVNSDLPSSSRAFYDVDKMTQNLGLMREKSFEFLKNTLNGI